MIIAVDFDGVIHDPYDREPGKKMGKPIPGAVAAMEKLADEGHDLIIHTLRGGYPEHVIAWLEYFGVPFGYVTNVKPDADVYLDDRALRFHNWDQALKELGWV